MIPKPCLKCGEPTDSTYCTEHKPAPREGRRTDTTKTAWKKLSLRARRLQPFCTFCGSTDDLQLDHQPAAWHAIANGRTVTLAMVQVTCRHCNVQLGSSQPGSTRYRHWEATGDDLCDLGGRGQGSGPLLHGEAWKALHMGTVLNSGGVSW